MHAVARQAAAATVGDITDNPPTFKGNLMSIDTLSITADRVARASARIINDEANQEDLWHGLDGADTGTVRYRQFYEQMYVERAGLSRVAAVVARAWGLFAWAVAFAAAAYYCHINPAFNAEGGIVAGFPLAIALHVAPWPLRRRAWLRLHLRRTIRYQAAYERAVSDIDALAKGGRDVSALREQIRRIEPGFQELLAELEVAANSDGFYRDSLSYEDTSVPTELVERCRAADAALLDVTARIVAASWAAAATSSHVKVDAPAPTRTTRPVPSKLTADRQNEMRDALARLEQLIG